MYTIRYGDAETEAYRVGPDLYSTSPPATEEERRAMDKLKIIIKPTKDGGWSVGVKGLFSDGKSYGDFLNCRTELDACFAAPALAKKLVDGMRDAHGVAPVEYST